MKFGVSPLAIWRNASTDPSGSDTQGGVETYNDLYDDTRRWVRQGWIDYVAPQVYWNIGFEVADYAELTRCWSRVAKGTGVQLFIGQAVYQVGLEGQPEQWQQAGELSKHIAFNRARRAAGFPVHGDMYYSATAVRANERGAIDLVTDRRYSRPALQPARRRSPGRHAAADTRAAGPALVGHGALGPHGDLCRDRAQPGPPREPDQRRHAALSDRRGPGRNSVVSPNSCHR